MTGTIVEATDTRLIERARASSLEAPFAHGWIRSSVRADIESAIERSLRITKLADDWDGEGSVGYARATWERATRFLQEVASWHYYVQVPVISPAEDGTIDLYWQLPDRSLLVNFAPNENGPATIGRRQDGGPGLRGPVGADDVASWLAAP
jgi:hypothetical protein